MRFFKLAASNLWMASDFCGETVKRQATNNAKVDQLGHSAEGSVSYMGFRFYCTQLTHNYIL
jgi:hypothetical protein